MSEGSIHPGATLGPYEVLDLIGRGGMGAVWRARHLSLGHVVAIKTLHVETSSQDPEHRAQALQRFHREGRALALIRHDHVVRVTDLGVVDDTMFLVMEHLEGEDLDRHLRAAGPMDVAALCDIMVPVCAGVAAAHEAGVVHRDLKPANVLLARSSAQRVVPKVLDFGVSRIDDAHEGLTGAASMLGTPRYMSPEQIRETRHVGPASDQYSLGVILYRGATGRCPVDDPVLLTLLQRAVRGDFLPPRALRPDLPVAFERVILRALANDPSQRFDSVRALGAALLPHASPRTRALHADLLGPESGATMSLDAAWPGSVPPSHAAAPNPTRSLDAAWPAANTHGDSANTLAGAAWAQVEAPPVTRPSRVGRYLAVVFATTALAGVAGFTWRASMHATPRAPSVPVAASAPVTPPAAPSLDEAPPQTQVLRAPTPTIEPAPAPPPRRVASAPRGVRRHAPVAPSSPPAPAPARGIPVDHVR